MNTLVFVLMLETLVDNYPDKIEEFGVFESIDHCVYFANVITRQGYSKYSAKLDYIDRRASCRERV